MVVGRDLRAHHAAGLLARHQVLLLRDARACPRLLQVDGLRLQQTRPDEMDHQSNHLAEVLPCLRDVESLRGAVPELDRRDQLDDSALQQLDDLHLEVEG